MQGGGGGGDFKPHKMENKQAERRQEAFKEQRKFAEERSKERQKFSEERRKFAEERSKERRKMVEERFKEREKFAERQMKAQEKAMERQMKSREKALEHQRKMQERTAERIDDDRFDDRWTDQQRQVQRLREQRFGQNGTFCPPGLAKKNNGCMPPGQLKQRFGIGEQIQGNWLNEYNVPLSYQSMYRDNPDSYYRYDQNGYIYRIDRNTNMVSGLIPLLGGGFGVGQMLPAGYDVYNVPYQYRDTYYDTNDSYYRYGGNAIYQVDPQTQLIQGVVALLTGQNLGVGQMMPAGYDMYNVPFQYRDQYYDTDQYNYRYADGNIYQVDPQTQIITAIIDALL